MDRSAEIVKGLIAFLKHENSDPAKESRRKSMIQILAAAAAFTAFLPSHVAGGIQKMEENAYGVFAFGLLASAGSALWNSVLEYVLKIKDLQ